MSFPGKGTTFEIDVADTLAPVAEIISLSHDGAESETYDGSTLDQSGAGHRMLATGYSAVGTVDLELFTNPVAQEVFTDEITTPTVVEADQLDAQVTLADTGSSAYPFKVAGLSYGFTVAQDDGVKSSISIVPNGLLTYPTTP